MISTKSVPKAGTRRFLPVVLLFFLAPLFGEYLLGNLKLSEIFYLPFIAPLYGAGALIIREATRRTGRGSATMLILGVAYGLFEEGIVDQMLFNELYFRGQDQITDTYIPVIGIDAWLTLIVLAMHAIWSICIPITLVEALFPQWEHTPWLSKTGLSIAAVVFVLGSIYLCYIISIEENFFASSSQLIGTTVVIVVLVGIAFSARRPMIVPAADFVPDLWLTGSFSFVASSLYMLTESLPGWAKVGACVLLLIVFFTTILLWSRRVGWSALHRLAIAGGGILTYAWLGILMEPDSGTKTVFDFAGSILIALGALLLLAFAVRKRQKYEITLPG